MSAARVACLATVDAAGHPHLVPIVFALTRDVLFTAVDDKPKRTRALRRLRNIESCPEVSVLIDHYDEDWARLWWCRLDGQARVVSEGDIFEAGIAALAEKYEQYRDEPPAGPVIEVEITDWTGWSASGREEKNA